MHPRIRWIKKRSIPDDDFLERQNITEVVPLKANETMSEYDDEYEEEPDEPEEPVEEPILNDDLNFENDLDDRMNTSVFDDQLQYAEIVKSENITKILPDKIEIGSNTNDSESSNIKTNDDLIVTNNTSKVELKTNSSEPELKVVPTNDTAIKMNTTIIGETTVLPVKNSDSENVTSTNKTIDLEDSQESNFEKGNSSGITPGTDSPISILVLSEIENSKSKTQQKSRDVLSVKNIEKHNSIKITVKEDINVDKNTVHEELKQEDSSKYIPKERKFRRPMNEQIVNALKFGKNLHGPIANFYRLMRDAQDPEEDDRRSWTALTRTPREITVKGFSEKPSAVEETEIHSVHFHDSTAITLAEKNDTDIINRPKRNIMEDEDSLSKKDKKRKFKGKKGRRRKKSIGM